MISEVRSKKIKANIYAVTDIHSAGAYKEKQKLSDTSYPYEYNTELNCVCKRKLRAYKSAPKFPIGFPIHSIAILQGRSGRQFLVGMVRAQTSLHQHPYIQIPAQNNNKYCLIYSQWLRQIITVITKIVFPAF